MIYINYSNVRMQIHQLQILSERCEQLARNYQSIQKGINVSWEGDSAEVFKAALLQRCRELNRIGESAQLLSNKIKIILERFEETERRLSKASGNGSFGSGGGGVR